MILSIKKVRVKFYCASDFMTFRFDIDKSIAATAFLIREAGGKWDTLFLVKALYLANRTSLVSDGRSITGDRLSSMENGPIVSNTYDLIKGSQRANAEDLKKWRIFISEREGHSIRVLRDPEYGYLSLREMDFLKQAFKVIRAVKGKVGDWSHDYFPEWEDHGKGSGPIDPKLILRLEHVAEDKISQIEEELAEINWLKAFAS